MSLRAQFDGPFYWRQVMPKWMKSFFVSGVAAPPPAPAIGQVWMSKRSGRCIRIADMHIADLGAISLAIQREQEAPVYGYDYNGLWYKNRRFNPTQSVFMVGLSEWSAMIENERRELI
jgi:hypothetical protein